MPRYHARWVLPITRPPIRDGTVAEIGGRVVYVGERAGAPPGADRELGDAILMPGLVNAHTHLELTAFRGLLEDISFGDWIARLQGAKRAVMDAERFLDSARLGIVEGLRAGITTYADTCDSGVTLQAMRELGVRGIMYQEVFCPSPDPVKVSESARALQQKLSTLEPFETELQRLGISPHAPYTVSDPLFALAARSGRPIATHVAESHLECELVCRASGVFADRLRAREIPVQPRGRSPVSLLQRLGVLDAGPLLIHCVQVDDEDLRAIADARCGVAHCPISNAKLAHGIAPVLEMLDAGIPVGLGSDSMASNNRMDLLEEARGAVLMQRVRTGRYDALSAGRALELATIGGARALGLGDRIGSLEVGKEADLAAFSLDDSPAEPTYDPVSSAVFALGGQPAKFASVAGNPRVWDWQLLAEDTRVVKRVRDTAEALEAWRGESQ